MGSRNCLSSPTVNCSSYPDTHCIVWSGRNLPCIGAVTNERLDSILTKINDKLCDIQATQKCYEIKFRVGDEGYPQDGATTYTPLNSDNTPFLAGKRVKLIREGDREYEKTGKGYALSSGTITFYPELYGTEYIIIEACPESMWDEFIPLPLSSSTSTTSTTSSTTTTTSTQATTTSSTTTTTTTQSG